MGNDTRVRVLVSDGEGIRDALLHALMRSPRLEAIADARSEVTSDLLRCHPPDILLVGTYPPQRALSLLKELTSLQSARRPLAIAHVTRDSPTEWSRWRALGFDGYLLKEVSAVSVAERLLAVIADVRGKMTA